MSRLLIADDSAVIRKVAKRILAGMGFYVAEADTAGHALSLCNAEMPDVLIVDAGMDGALDLIASVRASRGGANVTVYYCLVESDLRSMMQGKRAGADDFLMKPFDRTVLTNAFSALPQVA